MGGGLPPLPPRLIALLALLALLACFACLACFLSFFLLWGFEKGRRGGGMDVLHCAVLCCFAVVDCSGLCGTVEC